jgi:hypothetical protein
MIGIPLAFTAAGHGPASEFQRKHATFLRPLQRLYTTFWHSSLKPGVAM